MGPRAGGALCALARRICSSDDGPKEAGVAAALFDALGPAGGRVAIRGAVFASICVCQLALPRASIAGRAFACIRRDLTVKAGEAYTVRQLGACGIWCAGASRARVARGRADSLGVFADLASRALVGRRRDRAFVTGIALAICDCRAGCVLCARIVGAARARCRATPALVLTLVAGGAGVLRRLDVPCVACGALAVRDLVAARAIRRRVRRAVVTIPRPNRLLVRVRSASFALVRRRRNRPLVARLAQAVRHHRRGCVRSRGVSGAVDAAGRLRGAQVLPGVAGAAAAARGRDEAAVARVAVAVRDGRARGAGRVGVGRTVSTGRRARRRLV